MKKLLILASALLQRQIDTLWREIEWDWYTKGGEKVLYWHWSPDQGWAMNMQINGWNEALIVYVRAGLDKLGFTYE